MKRYLFIYVNSGLYSDRYYNRLIEAPNIYEVYELFNISTSGAAITNIIELKGDKND